MLETTVSVFWASANLDAIIEAVGATRKHGGRRAMTANACRMPPVVTPVNGDQLDGRHVSATDNGRCLAALQCLSYRLLAIEISVAHLARHLDEEPILAFSLSRSRQWWTDDRRASLRPDQLPENRSKRRELDNIVWPDRFAVFVEDDEPLCFGDR